MFVSLCADGCLCSLSECVLVMVLRLFVINFGHYNNYHLLLCACLYAPFTPFNALISIYLVSIARLSPFLSLSIPASFFFIPFLSTKMCVMHIQCCNKVLIAFGLMRVATICARVWE